jgi:triphosphatase
MRNAPADELVEGEELRLRPEDTAAEAAFRIFGRQFARLRWHEPGTRRGEEIEHLHDMRVAVRRLRAALRLFPDALAARATRHYAREFRWLGDALGRVRDLDVYLRLLDSAEGLSDELAVSFAEYRKEIQRQRDQAQARLARTLDSARYQRLLASFAQVLATGPHLPAAPVLAVGEELLFPALRSFRRLGRRIDADSSESVLHRLRIRGKRLRYACEFLADLYGEPAQELARRVTALQDLLGDHHDASVGQQRLARFGAQLTHRLPRRPAVFLHFGELMAWHSAHISAAHRDFLKAWKEFDHPSTYRPLLARVRDLATPPA